MNVDEAMAYWKQERTKDDMYYGMPETICDILSTEVERLRAEVQRLDIAETHTCHDDCAKLPCVQRREIERLKDENEWMGIAGQQMARHLAEAKAELAQSRKDWCDDDEAIKQQALRVLDAAKVEGDSSYVPRMGALAEMMANEIERLRNELWETKAENTGLQESHDKLESELAAAKAASVCPVKVKDCYSFGQDVEVECYCEDDADCLSGWLTELIKDNTPPAA